MFKNLLFFCYYGSTTHLPNMEVNLNCLKKYHTLFNGVKIIYVAVDREKIRDRDFRADISHQFDFLKDENTRIVFCVNDPENRESRYFNDMLKELHTFAPQENLYNSHTFFCHSKGISLTVTPDADPLKNWAVAMYYFNLDERFRGEVEEALETKYTFAGTFKQNFHMKPVDSEWHYSGTFYWFNTRKLLGTYSERMDRFSTEAWPGLTVESKLGYAINSMNCHKYVNLYYKNIWQKILDGNELDAEVRKELKELIESV